MSMNLMIAVPGRCAVQIRPCLVERRVPAGDVLPMACRLRGVRECVPITLCPGVSTRPNSEARAHRVDD